MTTITSITPGLSATKKPRVVKVPVHLQERFAPYAEKTPYVFRFNRACRRVMIKQSQRDPVGWVEKNRIVTHGALKNSTMRMEQSPHVVGQLIAAAHPAVRAIVVCAGPQSAKTTFVHSALGRGMDVSPGDILSVYPNLTSMRENCEERAQTMINASPRLRRMKTGNPDHFSKNMVKLQHLTWYFGSAGSPMAMSDRSIKYLDLQEVDKYDERPSAKEGGVIEFAEIRVTAFPHDHKIFITSTPTVESGPIWQCLTKECQVIFDYWVRCPHCGEEQCMVFEQIRWPKGDDGHSINYLEIKARKLAWYECIACGRKWDDRLRNQAIQTRTWRVRTADGSKGELLERYLETKRPARVGFHQPSWISRLVSLSTAAADFLTSQDKTKPRSRRKALLHNFLNKHKAEPQFDWEAQRATDAIMDLRDNRKLSVVPAGGQVAALFAGIDTQDSCLKYVIRAFGFGVDPTTWLIRFGEIGNGTKQDFDILAQILFEDVYRDENGLYYPVHLALQDAMGHRTDAVYNLTRRYPQRMLAYKGGQGRRGTPFTETVRDTFPGSKKPIPGGARLLTCDHHHYCDILSEQLGNKYGEPGCWYMSSEITKAYAAEMVVEYKDDDSKLWKTPDGKKNDYWDCEKMCLIAADYSQIRYRRKDG